MKPRTRLLLIIAVLAVIVSACSASEFAATVNSETITTSDVTDLRTAEVEAVVEGGQFRNDLTTLIVHRSTLDAAEEDFGITGLDTPEAREAYLSQASDDALNVVSSVAANPDLSEDAVALVTTQLMVRDAVIAELASEPELLEFVWQTQQQQLIEVCARHILVSTEVEAIEARDRVLAGEDFGAVADEVSLDTSGSGGQLPCPANPAAFVEPFASVVGLAPVGEVTVPFETDFGWHIVLVEGREGPASFEEFAEDAERWIPAVELNQAYASWRDEALGRATIVVRSQIGTWFAPGDGILPPAESP